MTRRLADNLFLLATIAGASTAWLIAFIGACIFRKGVSGGAWWIVIYQLFLILAISAVLITNTYAHYRMLILTLLAASISILTLQLDYALPTDKFNQGYRGGASAYAAGYVILIIIEFVWVIVFGSEAESYIGRLASVPHGNAANIIHTSAHHPSSQGPQIYEQTADKETIMTDSAAQMYHSYTTPATTTTTNHVVAPTTTTTSPLAASSVGPHTNASVLENADYRETVQALHAYQANPEDPNELSFLKGEVIDIVDKNGNWWQARKADGSTGIIPSNYFGSSN